MLTSFVLQPCRLLAAVALFLGQPAMAQVSVDQRALDQLSPGQPRPAPPADRVKPRPAARPRAAAAAQSGQNPATSTKGKVTTAPPSNSVPATQSAQPATKAPPPATIPAAPPPGPVLPPPVAVPTRPAPPPSPVPVVADAPGAAKNQPDGLRLTFGSGIADLNPATDEALRGLAHGAPAGASFNVSAFAAGTPDDPSTARRLSLSRALAVRSVLIAEGIPSVRIYVKALGASPGIAEGPADRVDVAVSAAAGQPEQPSSAAAPAAAAGTQPRPAQ